jgi:spermidine synthase
MRDAPMTETVPEKRPLVSRERCLPWLLLLFVGSGCAALVYEIVWFQLVELVIGSSAVSLGVLLGVYMGGMCAGSLLLPRLVPAGRHPLRVYAFLELGIGVAGMAILFGLPLAARLYAEHSGAGMGGIFLRGLLCAVLLLPPTLMMGATLPAIARWVEASPRGVSWLGYFYGGNIAGAVFGCLLAGFYLLRYHNVAVATYCAVGINLAVAGVGLLVASRSEGGEAEATPEPAEPARRAGGGATLVYGVIALSGMTALSAEVVWTRLLSLMLGGTVYTFSIILAVFLTGLGIGSAAGSALARSVRSPALWLGLCQLLLAGAVAWAALQLTRSLPFWPVNPYLTTSPWFLFQLDLLRCSWALLPAACLWGASFPLALGAAAAPGEDAGRLVGRVYAANTLGAIVGALATSVLFVSWLGSQRTQQILIGVSAGAGVLTLTALFLRRLHGEDGEPRRPAALAGAAVGLLACAAAAGWLVRRVAPVPWQLIAYGRYVASSGWGDTPLYTGEGMNASVAVIQLQSGARSFCISGKVEASSIPQDMRLQRMLGHLPALLHPKPKSVLVVGCGAGVTAGSFLLHPDVQRVVICELEPLIPRVVADHFASENYGVVHDPRVQVVYDDARHYILTTREKFDIITSDPIHPWVKGAAALYTQEYFDLCRRRLNPGGLVTQWVPLYESTLDVVKSEIATFFRAFPSGSVWSNDQNSAGYDTVLLGHDGPMTIDVDAMQARLSSPGFARVKESLKQATLPDSVDLLSTYAGRPSDLQPWLTDALINRDGNLRLQYLAGMSFNIQMSAAIYDTMLPYRRFPEGLFVGSEAYLAPLRRAIKPGPTAPVASEWWNSGWPAWLAGPNWPQ